MGRMKEVYWWAWRYRDILPDGLTYEQLKHIKASIPPQHRHPYRWLRAQMRRGKRGLMARHLGELDDAEFRTLEDCIVDWLEAHNVAGSIARDYSLYTAVQDEHEKAQLACESQREREKEASQPRRK